jgi:hypothetical protein
MSQMRYAAALDRAMGRTASAHHDRHADHSVVTDDTDFSRAPSFRTYSSDTTQSIGEYARSCIAPDS